MIASKNGKPYQAIIKFPLASKIKFSTNKFYAGIHWGKRKAFKDSITDTLSSFCKDIVPVTSYPIQISYRFIFRTRPLDTTNTSAMAKCFEDVLVSRGIIQDDSPVYITRTILEVVINKKAPNDEVIITINSI